MVAYKNNRKIRDLYPTKVLTAEFISVPGSKAEYGLGVVTNYNKDINVLPGDFCTIEVLCRVTNDDASTSVFKTSRLPDNLEESKLKEFTDKYLSLSKAKSKVFEDWKKSVGVKTNVDKQTRMKLFEEAGYVITSSKSEEEDN